MKKIIYISSVAFLALTITSCQKDEFNEAFENVNTEVEMRTSENAETIIKHENEMDEDDLDTEENDVIGFVKEVSDGDDEADSGDDSKKAN